MEGRPRLGGGSLANRSAKADVTDDAFPAVLDRDRLETGLTGQEPGPHTPPAWRLDFRSTRLDPADEEVMGVAFGLHAPGEPDDAARRRQRAVLQ